MKGAIDMAYKAGVYIYTHPLETMTGIEMIDGAYGGTPPSSGWSSIGKAMHDFSDWIIGDE